MIIYRYPQALSAEKPQGFCQGGGRNSSRCVAACETRSRPLLDEDVWELKHARDLSVSAFYSYSPTSGDLCEHGGI